MVRCCNAQRPPACRRQADRGAAGTRVSINTAFVERLNLTLRHALAVLMQRTPGLAKTKHHLQLRLNAYLVYYNLVRVHMTLKTTPACSVGLTDHAWTWEELLTFRQRPEPPRGGGGVRRAPVVTNRQRIGYIFATTDWLHICRFRMTFVPISGAVRKHGITHLPSGALPAKLAASVPIL